MHFFNLLPTILLSLSLSSATPTPTPESTTTPSPSTSTSTSTSTAFPTYYLRTKHATHKRHNDLYLSGYHVAAGQAMAVLTNDTTYALEGLMNGTAQQFFSSQREIASYFYMTPPGFGRWTETEIILASPGSDPNNPDSGTYPTAFSLDEKDGLTWDGSVGQDFNIWGGWLVCDWELQVPQVYWVAGSWDYFAPGCSGVKLVPEYL